MSEEAEPDTRDARELLHSADKWAREGNPAEALVHYERVATRSEEATPRALIASAMLGRARMLRALGRDGVVAALDDLVSRFADDSDPGVRGIVTASLARKAQALEAQGRYGDALQVRDDVLARLRDPRTPAARRAVLWALASKARVLVAEGQPSQAVAACDQLLSMVVEPLEPRAQPPVAAALARKARALRQLGRFDDALAAVGELVARFGTADDRQVQLQVAEGCWERGLVFSQTERRELAASACWELVKSLSGATEPELRAVAARALVQRAFNIERLGRVDEAIAAYGQVVECFAGAPDPTIAEKVAESRIHAAILLGMSRDSGILAEALEREDDPERLASFGRALVVQADDLLVRGVPEHALELLDSVIDALEDHDDRESRKVIALALASKSVALNRLDRPDAMEAALETMIERYGHEAVEAFQDDATRLWGAVEPPQLQRLAWVSLTQGMVLKALGYTNESQAILNQLVERFDGNTSPAITDTVAAARQLINELNQPDNDD